MREEQSSHDDSTVYHDGASKSVRAYRVLAICAIVDMFTPMNLDSPPMMGVDGTSGYQWLIHMLIGETSPNGNIMRRQRTPVREVCMPDMYLVWLRSMC